MPELELNGSLYHATVFASTIKDYQVWEVRKACPYQMKYLQAVPFQNQTEP